MILTYLGHSGLHIKLNGTNLVVDPFLTGNPLNKIIDADTLDADYILVTHGHQDHILDVEKIANRTGAEVIANYEIANYFSAKNMRTIGINHGGTLNFEFGRAKMVNAIHSSSFPDGSYAGNPSGFVIWDDHCCIYISGDTSLTMDMKLIPMTCPKPDLAVLCMGDHFTMGFKEAAIAAEFVNCNRVLACHYDSFDPIKIDKDAAKTHFSSKEIELVFLDIGQNIQI